MTVQLPYNAVAYSRFTLVSTRKARGEMHDLEMDKEACLGDYKPTM